MIQRNNRKRLNPRGKQQCIHCQEVKPMDKYNFVVDAKTRTGLASICRECKAQGEREIYGPRYLARKAAS